MSLTITKNVQLNGPACDYLTDGMQTGGTNPLFVLGMAVNLKFCFFDASSRTPVDLSAYTSFQFAVANDFNPETPPELLVSSGITVGGEDNNELTIPIENTNTEGIAALLGTTGSRNGVGCEIVAFEPGESLPGFVAQCVVDIRNRRTVAGTAAPIALTDEFYTAAQTDALLAGVAGAEPQIRYSADGVNVAASATGALFWSFRLGDDGVWSAWLPIPQPDTPAGRIETPFEVATASGDTAPETIELTYAALGVADPTDVSVFELESAGTELDITKSASLQIRWNDTTEKLLLSWNGGWPDGDYLVRG